MDKSVRPTPTGEVDFIISSESAGGVRGMQARKGVKILISVVQERLAGVVIIITDVKTKRKHTPPATDSSHRLARPAPK